MGCLSGPDGCSANVRERLSCFDAPAKPKCLLALLGLQRCPEDHSLNL